MTDEEIELQPTANRLEIVIRATLASTVNPYVISDIISLVRKGIKAEREACARVAEDAERCKWDTIRTGGKLEGFGAADIAAAIRKRGEK
jgi:hypothetical protein